MSVAKRYFKKSHKVTVTFYVKHEAAQGAQKIFLICEHNNWEPVALKPQKNGSFRGSITFHYQNKLAYQYRFKYVFADGNVKFDNDWDAESYTANPFGGENSVFTVSAEGFAVNPNAA